MHIVTQTFGWEVSRAAAFAALIAYTASLIWGFSMAGKYAAFRPAGASVEYHRWMSSLGLVAVLLHGFLMLIDQYANVSLANFFFIHTSLPLAAGMAGAWLMILLPVTIIWKKKRWISQKTWRKIHYSAWVVWPLIVYHGISMGTDQTWWAITLYAGCSIAVIVAAALRLKKRNPWMQKNAPTASTSSAITLEKTV